MVRVGAERERVEGEAGEGLLVGGTADAVKVIFPVPHPLTPSIVPPSLLPHSARAFGRMASKFVRMQFVREGRSID